MTCGGSWTGVAFFVTWATLHLPSLQTPADSLMKPPSSLSDCVFIVLELFDARGATACCIVCDQAVWFKSDNASRALPRFRTTYRPQTSLLNHYTNRLLRSALKCTELQTNNPQHCLWPWSLESEEACLSANEPSYAIGDGIPGFIVIWQDTAILLMYCCS